ncbi:IQ motif, EF-hand binding site [Kalmanozyma brasiliensis GHG001]|uniref:IQ calmodulin-binding motif protein n=1 Tax=Kalmanozyma brasiliensis (strain GHG001) TaxID=1365824 RepID=V5EPG8_KALBG|nr:IQ motif, EF-hand binding site [Kalmanozyma brasiliensis GHG001]EST04833.1 IQ motif, EF-hand binding site [Kalmanozyma brasiliensis GHG001]
MTATQVRTIPPVVEAQQSKESKEIHTSEDTPARETPSTKMEENNDTSKAQPNGDEQQASAHDHQQSSVVKSESKEEPKHEHNHDNDDDKAAALLIQRNYRGYRTRRQLDGCNISADTRWSDAVHRMRLEQANKHSANDRNDASSRWKRGKLLAGQLSGGEKMDPSSEKDGGNGRTDEPVEGGPSLESPKKEEDEHSIVGADTKVGDVPGAQDGGKVDNIRSIADRNQKGLKMIEWWTRGGKAQELSKMMEEQYWLEMVDRKHRYGSNLKYYHQAWQQADTKDNFFKWLDEGEGKEVSIDDCPRERLDSECVIYLSSEQRRNYIVDIEDGKLIWRRNGKPVDTARNKHKDMGKGRGIVDIGEEEQEEIRADRERRALQRGVSESSLDSYLDGTSSSSSSDSSDGEEMSKDERKDEAKHYQSKRSGKSRHLDALSPSNWSDMLLRKTIGNNTWIYVFNSRHELYIGLKQTGYFQHSSFLYGGRVLSAGLLKVDNGTLTSLSPLSGHYRAGTAHFRYFVKKLQDSGVDLDRVALSKSLLMLAGMEKYGKVMSKAKSSKKQDKKKKEKNRTDANGDDEQGKEKESLAKRLKQKLSLGSKKGKDDEVDAGEEADTEDKPSGFARLKEKLRS